MTPELEEDIHELFLRYRAPNMGGPYVVTHLRDPAFSQADMIRFSRGPIWSGGMHYLIKPQPTPEQQWTALESQHLVGSLEQYMGLDDDPSDSAVLNQRYWVERDEEGLPGEYFAAKDSVMFGWAEKKVKGYNFVNTTRAEKFAADTLDFHFAWKGGQVTRINTTDYMRNWYTKPANIYRVMEQRQRGLSDLWKYRHLVGLRRPYPYGENFLDIDLVDKLCREKHGIDLLDPEYMKRLRSLDAGTITKEQWATLPYWDAVQKPGVVYRPPSPGEVPREGAGWV